MDATGKMSADKLGAVTISQAEVQHAAWGAKVPPKAPSATPSTATPSTGSTKAPTATPSTANLTPSQVSSVQRAGMWNKIKGAAKAAAPYIAGAGAVALAYVITED